jgi:hypothetical protein
LLKTNNNVGAFILETEENREQIQEESFKLNEISIISAPRIPLTPMATNTSRIKRVSYTGGILPVPK